MTDAEIIQQGIIHIANVLQMMAKKDATKHAPGFFENIPGRPLKIVVGDEQNKVELHWELSLKVVKQSV